MSQKPDNTFQIAVRDFLLGGIAGGVSKTAVAPIERVKLLLQLQDVSTQISSTKNVLKTSGDRAPRNPLVAPYKGFIDCFRRVYFEQGFVSYWRGNVSNVVRYFPTQAINFSTKEAFQRRIVRHDKHSNFGIFFLENLASGGLAGATSLCVVYPLDFARTRLGVDVGGGSTVRQFSGLTDCLSRTYREGGVSSLYKGFTVSLAGIVVYRAAFFGCYDTAKALVYDDPRKSNPFVGLGIGFLVETVAGVLAYPFDTVRRRMMMQTGRNDVLYNSTTDCWKRIWRNEGPRAYFKGCYSNIVRGLGGAIVLVLYDELQKLATFSSR